jgi:MFS family permease
MNTTFSGSTIRGLSALYAGTFFSGAWAMILPTIPVLARQFDVSAGAAAQIVTAFAAGKFVGTVIAGVLLDRMGTRVALIGGPLAATLASLCVVWAPWFSVILFLALMMGAADSLWATAREIAGIDLAHRSQRGRIISGLHGVHTMGAAFAPFLGGWLTETYDFQAAFIGYASATALSVPLGFIGPPSAVHARAEKPKDKPQGWSLAAVAGRLRAIKHLYREIEPQLRPTYCAIVFATLVNQFHRVRNYCLRHDHSRRVSHGPRRQKMVHGAEHGHSRHYLPAHTDDRQLHPVSRFNRRRRAGAGIIIGFVGDIDL